VSFFLVGPYDTATNVFRGTLDIRCASCAKSTVRPISLVGPELRAWLVSIRASCHECGERVTAAEASAPVRSGDGQ
jgi:hypothetical protein